MIKRPTWLAATPRLSLTIFRWKLWADLKCYRLKSGIYLTKSLSFRAPTIRCYLNCFSCGRFTGLFGNFSQNGGLWSDRPTECLWKSNFEKPWNPHICRRLWQLWFSPEECLTTLPNVSNVLKVSNVSNVSNIKCIQYVKCTKCLNKNFVICRPK